LSSRLLRDEHAVAEQRKVLAERYGLQTMISNLLQIYLRFGIEPPGCSRPGKSPEA